MISGVYKQNRTRRFFEQDRDPSSQGALHALSCRAVLPDPAVKEEVWGSITTDPDLSNYELYALVEAFFRRDQVEPRGHAAHEAPTHP